MTSVKIAMVGCGAIAERFHLPALRANPATRAGIVLVDSNPDRLAQLAHKFGVTHTATSYRELPVQVDGAILATPPATHRELALHFLLQQVHVLCEKPLADSAAEAKEMAAAAEANGVTLAVNQTRRLFPTYGAIRAAIAAGELGEIQSLAYHEGCDFDWPAASAFHFAPGARGVLSDVGVHILDAICFWLGATPEFVSCETDSSGGPEAMAKVRLAHHGRPVEVIVSRLGRLPNKFRIEGSRGVIEAGHEDWREVVIVRPDGRRKKLKPACSAQAYTDFATPLIANFADVIGGRAKPLIPATRVLGALELIDDAYAEAQPLVVPWNACYQQPKAAKSPLPRVLVTGSSGFLGARLVEVMKLTGDAEPVAAVRQWARAARAARHPMEFALFDILSAERAKQAVQNLDAVVHCAYAGDPHSIVEGTRNLLDAAMAANVKRFVFLSSAEVYGASAHGVVDETTPTSLTGRAYGDAKIEAERLVFAAGERGLPVVVLRPALIYGPEGKSWTANVAKRLLSGAWGRLEEYGEGLANLVYVDDLAQAILRSLVAPAAVGEAFNINGPDRVTWNDYFEQFNAALGNAPLPSIAPGKSRMRSFVMDQFGKATDVVLNRFEDRLMEIYLRGGWMSRVMKQLKRQLDVTPSQGELTDLYSRTAEYSDAKAHRLLGYLPQVSLSEGLKLSVAWLEQQMLIDRPRVRPSAPQRELQEALA